MELPLKKYRNKKVLVTGHTGFKGSWLTLWLKILGAEVIGISKEILNGKGLYSYLTEGDILSTEYFLDIVNLEDLKKAILESKPDYIFHLAAQPIVSKSYLEPSLTFYTNAIGTMNILESIREIKDDITVVLITSDKCYENVETYFGYKEIDKLGGKDPYSASKACAEIISNSYIRSIYKDKENIRISTARAGNVVGGGDWSQDRLIPDAVKAWQNDQILNIRNPKSTRPWQHVLEPISGYLILGTYVDEKKILKNELSCSSFNFGPRTDDVINVEEVIKIFSDYWRNAKYVIKSNSNETECSFLNLSYDKASTLLGWQPKLNALKSLKLTAEWYLAQERSSEMLDFSIEQINQYTNL